MTLEAPRRDSRIVDSAVEREVHLHVPLQPVDGGAGRADAQVRRQQIRSSVRDHVPVAGWRLGRGAIGPELDHRPVEVTLPHDVCRVRPARDGVERIAMSVVRPEMIGADRARRDVDRQSDRCIEQAAVSEDLDGLNVEDRVGQWVTQARLRPWIDGSAGCAADRDREGGHMAPMRPDGLLNAVRHRDSVLADHVLELERLPAVRVDERDPWLGHDEWRIHGFVGRVRIPVHLVRAVGFSVVEHRLRDLVADRRR